MIGYKHERELERLRDWLVARLNTAPNQDSREGWIYQGLRRAYELAERGKS